MDRGPTQRQSSPPPTSWRGQRDGSATAPLKRKLTDVTGGKSYDDLMAQGKLLRSTASRIPPQESLYTCRVYYLNQALDAFQQALNASATLSLAKHTQDCLEQIRETQIDLMVLSRMSKPTTSTAHQNAATGTRTKQRLRVTVRHRPPPLLSTSCSSDTTVSLDSDHASPHGTTPARSSDRFPHAAMTPSPPSPSANTVSFERFRGFYEPPAFTSELSHATAMRPRDDDYGGSKRLQLPPPFSQPPHQYSSRPSPQLFHDLPKLSLCLPPRLSLPTPGPPPMADAKAFAAADPSSLLSVAHTLMSIADPRSPP